MMQIMFPYSSLALYPIYVVVKHVTAELPVPIKAVMFFVRHSVF